ncbi:MAG: ORF6N domain-containing protein [Candidatus Omnitrophica bacterium]|nr:ORF6N domain-containing protein [Candidatus Omnitrophota bacterium]
MNQSVLLNRIEHLIFLVRGHKIMLDDDLAMLYGVTTKRLNEQVRRNRKRFPSDFMFQLTLKETISLRSQFATSKAGRGGRRYRPYAFTEQGVAMLSSVLNSEKAIQVNIVIMRIFTRLRRALVHSKNLQERLKELGNAVGDHDVKIRIIFDAIRQLMAPTSPSRRRIGFHREG